MAAFITIVIHFAVSYLHILFAWRFYPRRHEDYSVSKFWIMMLLWAVLHALYGTALLLEEMEPLNTVYFFIVIICYTLVPFTAALYIPIILGELTVAPVKPNPVSSILLLVSRNIRFVFWFAIFLAFVGLIWSLLHLYPLEEWKGEYGNISALYGLFVFGAIWILMLASGIRPDERWNDLGHALRIFFALMLVMLIYEYFSGFDSYWSAIPVLSSLGFSFLFSWYRFRLQFMDMILNQCVAIAMLVATVLGLSFVVSTTAAMEPSLQYLALIFYVLIAGLCFTLVNRWFSLLWAPPEKVLQQLSHQPITVQP